MRQVKTLFGEDVIRARVGELAAELREIYKNSEPVLLGVLKGCVYFLSDLSREMGGKLAIDFMAVESYEGVSSTGAVKIRMDLGTNIEGRDVLVVEDIVDTGLTLGYIIDLLESRNPRSIKVVSLLFKPAGFSGKHRPDFVGFEIPNDFVVGYGMDLGERYRNLRFIGRLQARELESG